MGHSSLKSFIFVGINYMLVFTDESIILYVSHIVHTFFQALNGKLLKTRDKSTRRDIQKELRSLSKEERKRQQLAVTDVIKSADVVLTTLTGSCSRKLENTSFDLVIIDEAAQALEIACWIALLKVMIVCRSRCTTPKCKCM